MNDSDAAAQASALPSKRYTSGNSAWYTPGSSGPKPRRCTALLAVSDSAPSERPWKLPRNAIIPCRLVK